MPLKSIFKSHSSNSKHEKRKSDPPSPHPEFTFIRSDTTSETVIHPPTGFPEDDPTPPPSPHRKRRSSIFSHRRNKSSSSVHVPANLPRADTPTDWEKRATVLVSGDTPPPPTRGRSRANSVTAHDDDIQAAIDLHQSGNYGKSTEMFGRLAEGDNPLSQVLYGLALRHGWGIEQDEARAVSYLQRAARNSAALEAEALKAGSRRGGVAKGELTLAIYELANSYRNGWGVEKDAAAAREYYETAANLGDADAQNEAGWCYVEGFGCKKDKKKAARYYRMAEKQGVKIPTNSWIYKDKYMDGED